MSPDIPENREIITENKWYSLILEARFLLAAAGRISKALIIKIPTHLIENIIIIAMTTLKQSSIILTLMFLLLARDSFTPTACSLLNPRNQNRSVTRKIITNKPISPALMLNMSPTRRFEYFENSPPWDRIIRPKAMLKEENTEITVSVDTVFLLFILFSNNANRTAKISMDRFISANPNIDPSAIPVKAECPRASEKNAIRLLTIIVPRIPNRGVMINMARRAFFINVYSVHENGRSISMIL